MEATRHKQSAHILWGVLRIVNTNDMPKFDREGRVLLWAGEGGRDGAEWGVHEGEEIQRACERAGGYLLALVGATLSLNNL